VRNKVDLRDKKVKEVVPEEIKGVSEIKQARG
jgi:hypothetical protein